jgi:hypothetical protein
MFMDTEQWQEGNTFVTVPARLQIGETLKEQVNRIVANNKYWLIEIAQYLAFRSLDGAIMIDSATDFEAKISN